VEEGGFDMKLIISPHPDDAFLSLSNFLANADGDVLVVTFEGDEMEALNLSNWFKIKTLYISVPEGDLNYYSFYKTHNKGKLFNANEIMKNFSEEDFLQKIKDIKDFSDEVYLPLGVGHPYHYFLKLAFEKIFKDKAKIFYYQDYFHSLKKTFALQLLEATKDKKLFSELPPTDNKKDLFLKLFPSQRGYFWFEKRFFDLNPKEKIWVMK
jgi:hypothetical protein